jgi:hypothetical protein
MNVTLKSSGALRRTRRAVGRFWQLLTESAVPRNAPLHDDRWNDYPRFPWF